MLTLMAASMHDGVKWDLATIQFIIYNGISIVCKQKKKILYTNKKKNLAEQVYSL